MFLDAFMNTSESSIPDLNDLQLEYAVSLEAAYNDFMLEGCRLEFQAISENSSVEVLNEGIFDLIKKFFKAIWNFLKKIFGVKGSGGSSGGGGSSSSSGGGSSSGGSTNTKEQKKESEKLDKELEDKKEEIENMIAVAKEADSMKSEAEEKLKKNMDEAQKKVEKEKKPEKTEKSIQQIRDEVEKQIMDEIRREINRIRTLMVKDPFIDICPISASFFNTLVDEINDLCDDMRKNVSNIDQAKFKLMQSDIEAQFLEYICNQIDHYVFKMRKDNYNSSGNWHFMSVETFAVQEVISRYKKITAPREDFLFMVLANHNDYSDFKKVIKGIRDSANDELNIDFQAQLDNLSKETMNDIKQDNSYTDADIGSLVARVKMRLITDLAQIIGAIGIENKKARLYQLNSIRNALHAAKKLDLALFRKADVHYLYTEMRKRGVEP